MRPVSGPSLADIKEARQRIAASAIRTPLVRLNVDDAPATIYLKLENLQPIGSFKLRGAGNAMRMADSKALKKGVYTASAGNMAQGVAWTAREMGVRCDVVVPDHAPAAKIDAIELLGARVKRVSFDEWWKVFVEHRFPGMKGLFIHPVADTAVMAGNGTIGLEILEDLPDVDAVLVPFGGGGLLCGIATALRALRPHTRIYACEADSASPLKASLDAGRIKNVDYQPSFVDGIGGKTVLKEMWPLVRRILDDSIVMRLDEIAATIRMLVHRHHVIAEGAGATPVAAALSGRAGKGKIVCIVSGGNIDAETLTGILLGKIP